MQNKFNNFISNLKSYPAIFPFFPKLIVYIYLEPNRVDPNVLEKKKHGTSFITKIKPPDSLKQQN